MSEALEPRVLLAADTSGMLLSHNTDQPADVDGDSYVAPLDALLVIYALSRGTEQMLGQVAPPPASEGEPGGAPHLDVNNDAELSAEDVEAVFDALNAEGENGIEGKDVRFRVEVTDLNGNPLTEVNLDDVFNVNIYVQDLRTNVPAADRGVFSAFVDLEYNAGLADPESVSITHGPQFSNTPSGSFTDGLLDEAGGISGLEPLGADEHLLVSVRLRATNSGTIQFTTNAADQLPLHEVVLFGGETAVPNDRIAFGMAQLTVRPPSENAPDLVAFAQALAAAGTKFYGAAWCPECTAQKQLFEDGGKYLPFIEVTNPDRTPNQIAIDNDIQTYPTWEFPDGSRLEGLQSLATLAERSNLTIPTSDSPFLAELEDVTLLAGSPLHIPLDGYDPNGEPLTYTVTSDNPSLVAASLITGNRSARFTIQGFGEMVFMLYEQRAPRATERIIALAEDGFYDGVTFHRVLNDFVIQAGDPTGTGSGGSPLPDFDDQFHFDLQHNRTGVLSMAKSFDDTNDSQFFITEGPQRHLDFNHTVFGQLIEGELVRDAISNTAVDSPSTGRPTTPVSIQSVQIFQDMENGLLMLKAPEGETGTANITVTVTDQQGNSHERTFQVTVAPDTDNGGPFLKDIGPIETLANTPVTFQLEAMDVEGDAVRFSATAGTSNFVVNVDEETGEVEVIPPILFAGQLTVTAEVRAAPGVPNDTLEKVDSQEIVINVLPTAPLNLALGAEYDSGLSNSDGITNVIEPRFNVAGVFNEALVEVFAGDTRIGSLRVSSGGTASVRGFDFGTLADGEYQVRARQEVDGLFSDFGEPITVVVDRTAPPMLEEPVLPAAIIGQQYTFNIEHPEEATTGMVYELRNAPSGMSIAASTGVITWNSPAATGGSVSFDLAMRDAAGNETVQPIELLVQSDQPEVRIRLETTDMDGNPITEIESGQQFLLRALVEDLTDEPTGVFAAYLDVTYNASLASPAGSLMHGDTYGTSPSGTLTTPGLIDEAGSTDGITNLGEGEFLLWSLPMRADGPGTVNFVGNHADMLPVHAVLRYDQTAPVDPTFVRFEGTSLTVLVGLTAADDTLTVPEDSADHVIDVLANDSLGPNGGTLEIVEVSTPNNGGTATIIDEGTRISYTPAAGFSGTETFTYTISDGQGGTATGTVTVTVTDADDLPTAADDTATTAEDTSVTIDVLANDSTGEVPDETLTITEVGTPTSGGTATISNGRIQYTPPQDFFGTDEFTYTIQDTAGGTATGTVTVTVTAVNDPPTAGNDTATVAEDGTLTIDVADLLENDSPGPDNESSQQLTIVSVTSSSGNATVTLSGNTITYQPDADFFGTDTFTYTVRDDGETNGNSDPKTITATVTVTVTAVNDDPTAVDDTVEMFVDDGSIDIDVLANDSSDPDGEETLTVTEVSAGSQGGTITIIDSGARVRYTPAANFTGTETFTYTISDGNGGTAEATVTVEVVDFRMSTIAGIVYFDKNNNGMQDTGERGLAGVEVVLEGTDMDGAQVQRTQRTDKDGKYLFDEVKPGSYTVRQQQPMFLQDGKSTAGNGSSASGANQLSIEISNQGIESTNNNFGERGLQPRFAIWDALASSSSQGVLAALSAEGESSWVRPYDGWDRFVEVEVELDEDGEMLRIVGVEENGSEFETSVSLDDKSRVRVIASEADGSRLLRISSPESGFTWTRVTSTASQTDAAFAE